ncbi:hypothetical protein KP77_08690 [Jeotgalibacillus alimentarius]|uniref:Uncharacterized protein n=1 Tax=Jeotgalibacillus alimentarius TaxID=135826 RepID=A0A0C2VR06_9BACL|nr:hypothetical protein KP77_08690 [Jeotgalibacillus alimentarius]
MEKIVLFEFGCAGKDDMKKAGANIPAFQMHYCAIDAAF